MFSDPDKNIDQFNIGEGWKVADFGVGVGAYTLAAAEAVGPDGHIYAIDVNDRRLQRVIHEARERRISWLEIISGDFEKPNGSKLRDGVVDAAIATNVFWLVDKKDALVAEIKRTLRNGGRVLVVDWSGSFGGIGPKENRIVPASELRDLFKDAGFTYERSIDAGAHHYGFIVKKP